jgi:hypothetical protein
VALNIASAPSPPPSSVPTRMIATIRPRGPGVFLRCQRPPREALKRQPYTWPSEAVTRVARKGPITRSDPSVSFPVTRGNVIRLFGVPGEDAQGVPQRDHTGYARGMMAL